MKVMAIDASTKSTGVAIFDNGNLITYNDLCKEIDNQTDPRNVASYLGDISCWCAEIGAPMLSAVVINNKSNRPGKGFLPFSRGTATVFSDARPCFESCRCPF